MRATALCYLQAGGGIVIDAAPGHPPREVDAMVARILDMKDRRGIGACG